MALTPIPAAHHQPGNAFGCQRDRLRHRDWPVQLIRGTLAGTGTISGPVTVAARTASASLAPGTADETGTLSIQSPLTFGSRGDYKADLDSTAATADQVSAVGITINSRARISIDDIGSGTLVAGTVFTITSNTGTAPIAGTLTTCPTTRS